MATNMLKTRIKHKIDTASNWASSNLVPLEGELVIYKGDRPQIKVGDGSTAIGSLPFVKAGSDTTITQTITSGTEIGSISIDGVATKLYAPSTIAWSSVTGKPNTFTPSEHSHDYFPAFITTSMAEIAKAPDAAVSGWYHVSQGDATIGPTTNHGSYIIENDVGTPYQIFFPDNSLYMYKRYSVSGSWNSWSKMSAGYADSAATASTATKLATARTISLTGSVTGSGSFDGSGNLSIATATNHTHTSLPDGTSISGHLRVGNNVNGDTNYIAFYGTSGDQPGSYNHTFIGENLYGTTEASELIIFKGNDVGNGPTVPSEPGPERIRHIAATHLFQSYTTALLGSFVEICDSTVPINIMGIDSAGVYVYKNLTVNGTLTGNLNGNANSASKLANARTFTIGNGSSSFDGTADVSLDTSKIFTTYTSNQSVSWDDLSTGFTEMIGDGDVLWNGTNNPSDMPGFYRWGGTLTLNANGCNCGAFAQLYFAHTSSSGAGILYRSGWYSDRQPWARILDSNNYTYYCAPASHTHSYLPLAGGTLTGALNLANGTWNKSGDDCAFGDSNTGGSFSIQGLNANTNLKFVQYGGSNYATITYNGSNLTSSVAFYGAVWNDYAEFRQTVPHAKPGQIVIENGDGTQRITTERLQRGCNVVSDTFGFAIGETDECKTPIACAGRALVYTYENRYDFQPGEAVCSGPNGTVSRMTREEMINNPDCIVGFVSEIPEYEVWGTGNVEVDGRIWIKVK